LSEIFPNYFKKIKPFLINIKEEMSGIRSSEKSGNKVSINNFALYFDQIKTLIDIKKEVDIMIPSLEEYQNKSKREFFWSRLWVNFLIPIIASLITGICVYYFTHNSQQPNPQSPTPIEKKIETKQK
jgi:hypothetical protein